MIPKELDNLIKEYLSDGIINEEERQILLQKAEKLGLDVDEIDLYIDAQQQKSDKVNNKILNRQKADPCPFCGGALPVLAEKCPHCNKELTPQANEDLKLVTETLEDYLFNLKTDFEDRKENKSRLDLCMKMAKYNYGENPKVKILLSEIEKEAKSANRKAATSNIINKTGETISTFFKIIKYTIFTVCIIIVLIFIYLLIKYS